MKGIIGVTALLALGVSGSAMAVQSTFPFQECRGCTAAQMQAKAQTMPKGIDFVYDIQANIVRKYYVERDSTCAIPPVIMGQIEHDPASVDANQAAPDRTGKDANGVDCGPYVLVTPMTPVDASVLHAFSFLVSAYNANHNLVLYGVARHDGVPMDYDTNQPFSLPGIAWEYPQGAYDRFMNQIKPLINNQANANNYVPGLGDEMYGWSVSSYSVTVQTPSTPDGPPTLSGSITADRSSQVELSICDNSGNCAKFNINVGRTGVANIVFAGVVGPAGNYYPVMQAHTPTYPDWRFHNGLDSEVFANGMRGNGIGITETLDGCGGNPDYYISCTWQGAHLIGCRMYCQ